MDFGKIVMGPGMESWLAMMDWLFAGPEWPDLSSDEVLRRRPAPHSPHPLHPQPPDRAALNEPKPCPIVSPRPRIALPARATLTCALRACLMRQVLIQEFLPKLSPTMWTTPPIGPIRPSAGRPSTR